MYFDISYFLVFGCSALICSILLLTKQFHIRKDGSDSRAIQSAHVSPTPRIGGVAIGAGLLLSAFFVPADVKAMYILYLSSLAPVFIAGLAEDLGVDVSPRRRLMGAALSSLMAVVLLQTWVTNADVPGLNTLLAFAPFGILFTVFATTGVCNAFNLIDGINGLSAGTGVVVALGLAAMADVSGQPQLASICFVLVAALMGFLVFNFPWGKIFLGDAGAYSLGHALAWLAVILMFRSPDLSPWAVVLVFFWPLADTFFAIYRRRRSGRPTDQPDRLHFHQLVMRALEIKLLGRQNRKIANPLATLVLMPLVTAPVVFGVMLWDKPLLAFASVISFSGLFFGTYMMGVRLARTGRPMQRDKSQAATSGFMHPAE